MSSESFVRRAFASRIADLGFALELPASWQLQDLPDETPDFDDGKRVFGLAAATAPYAALVFAAAARPAFDDGTVHDWALWLVQQHAVDVRAIGPSTLGELPAIVGQCAAASDIGEMLTHFAFAEDGQRLLYVSVTGPAAMAQHVWQVWSQVQRTFALETPRGSTTPLMPQVQPQQPPPGSNTTVADIGSYALEGGRATLLQDHPINRKLMEQGRGFVPRLLAADDAQGRAWVASMALRASLALPYGWHPLDDSRRLVLLHPDGSVQVSLETMTSPDGSVQPLLDRIEAAARADYPAPECLRLQSGAITGLAVRNIHDGQQPLQQLHLLMAAPDAGVEHRYVRARVTTTPEQMSRAADLGEALLFGLQFDSTEARAEPMAQEEAQTQPEWALRAYALEAEGKLEEAEQAMLKGCNQLGVLFSIAHLYRDRLARLAAAGDAAGAAHARERAEHWAWAYAAGATSGGEGAALSRERDAFIASLPPA